MKFFWQCLLLCLLVLAGCSSAPLHMPTELRSFKPSADFSIIWHGHAGMAGAWVFQPAVVRDTLFTANADGNVTRWDDEGRKLWQIYVDEALSGGVGADLETIAVGTFQGKVIALDAASGKQKWSVQLTSEIIAPPLVRADLVIVRSADASITAFGSKDGVRRWHFRRNQPSLTVRSTTNNFLVVGSNLIAGFPGASLVALNIASGALLWEGATSIAKGTNEIERIADITSEPIRVDDKFCAIAYQGRMACYDIKTFVLAWTKDIDSATGLATDGKNIYLANSDGEVRAFRASNGSPIWEQTHLAYRGISRPFIFGEYIVVGDQAGFLHALKRSDGSLSARLELEGAIVANIQPFIYGFLVQTDFGKLYAITVR